MEFELTIRFACAFFSGALLCLGGSLTQIFTQNEIASPSTLGFDGLIVLQIILFYLLQSFFDFADFLPLDFGSFVLTFIPLTVILFLSSNWKFDFQKRMTNLILFGICFNLFVGALFSLLYFLFLTKSIQFPSHLWFGTFKSGKSFHLVVLSCTFLLFWPLACFLSKRLQFLVYGPDFCMNLKISPHQFFRPIIVISYLSVAVTTCFFGVFSFLSLLFPHLLRGFSFFSKSVKKELTIGPLICGILFAIIDQLTYQFPFYGAEIPVGMISSVLGTCIFIFILLRKSTFSR